MAGSVGMTVAAALGLAALGTAAAAVPGPPVLPVAEHKTPEERAQAIATGLHGMGLPRMVDEEFSLTGAAAEGPTIVLTVRMSRNLAAVGRREIASTFARVLCRSHSNLMSAGNSMRVDVIVGDAPPRRGRLIDRCPAA